jgi:hypothetical protein
LSSAGERSRLALANSKWIDQMDADEIALKQREHKLEVWKYSSPYSHLWSW